MKALILLGCPETPSQTPMSIYASYKLSEKGYDVTIAANPAASKLVKVSDPEKYYIQEMVDLDDCLANVQEGEYDLLLGFVHKDAAASYFVTFYQLLQTKSIALVFEKDSELLKEYTEIVSENTDAEVISVRSASKHSPACGCALRPYQAADIRARCVVPIRQDRSHPQREPRFPRCGYHPSRRPHPPTQQ